MKIDGENPCKTGSPEDPSSRRRGPLKAGEAERKARPPDADQRLLEAVWETVEALSMAAPSVEAIVRGVVTRPNPTGAPWGAGGAWTWDRHVAEGRIAVPAAGLDHLLRRDFGLTPTALELPDGTRYRGYSYDDAKLAWERANREE